MNLERNPRWYREASSERCPCDVKPETIKKKVTYSDFLLLLFRCLVCNHEFKGYIEG